MRYNYYTIARNFLNCLSSQLHSRFISRYKGKAGIAVHGTPCISLQLYGVSLAIWDHTVLPATRHKWAHPAFTPASQAGTRFTYPWGMEGWVDIGDLLHTEVYPPTDGHHASEYTNRARCRLTSLIKPTYAANQYIHHATTLLYIGYTLAHAIISICCNSYIGYTKAHNNKKHNYKLKLTTWARLYI